MAQVIGIIILGTLFIVALFGLFISIVAEELNDSESTIETLDITQEEGNFDVKVEETTVNVIEENNVKVIEENNVKVIKEESKEREDAHIESMVDTFTHEEINEFTRKEVENGKIDNLIHSFSITGGKLNYDYPPVILNNNINLLLDLVIEKCELNTTEDIELLNCLCFNDDDNGKYFNLFNYDFNKITKVIDSLYDTHKSNLKELPLIRLSNVICKKYNIEVPEGYFVIFGGTDVDDDFFRYVDIDIFISGNVHNNDFNQYVLKNLAYSFNNFNCALNRNHEFFVRNRCGFSRDNLLNFCISATDNFGNKFIMITSNLGYKMNDFDFAIFLYELNMIEDDVKLKIKL